MTIPTNSVDERLQSGMYPDEGNFNAFVSRITLGYDRVIERVQSATELNLNDKTSCSDKMSRTKGPQDTIKKEGSTRWAFR